MTEREAAFRRNAPDESAPSGVPREDRRDALLAAVELVSELEKMWKRREAAGEDLVCTVGELYTDSKVHTITKIPGDGMQDLGSRIPSA